MQTSPSCFNAFFRNIPGKAEVGEFNDPQGVSANTFRRIQGCRAVYSKKADDFAEFREQLWFVLKAKK